MRASCQLVLRYAKHARLFYLHVSDHNAFHGCARYFLLRESMLDSVLVARDRFLAPGGSLFPSHARLYLAPMRSTHAHHRKAEFQARTGDPLAVWQSALCRHACLYVAPAQDACTSP